MPRTKKTISEDNIGCLTPLDIKVKKLHPDAIIPSYAIEGDAGMDITAIAIDNTEDYVEYSTGLSFEIPEGYVMLIFPRSSNSKKDLLLCNSVGVLDSGYRGELKFRYKRVLRPIQIQPKDEEGNPQGDPQIWFSCDRQYEVGDRIGQVIIIPYPTINFVEVEELSETKRGERGFGEVGGK